MSHVKNLVKILLLVQCLLLCCVCGNKETAIEDPTEQQRSNLADFVKCPFKEEFKNNTNLEKYVLKKFGKPDSVEKWKDVIHDYSDVVVDRIDLNYKGNYLFSIYRGIKKKFEVFKKIFILNFSDLKYGINKEATVKDIERLFGQPNEIQNIQREENKKGRPDMVYHYSFNCGDSYVYHLSIGFRKKKLDSVGINVNIIF